MVLPTTASSDESTMAASRDRTSSAFLRSVTSRMAPHTRVPSWVRDVAKGGRNEEALGGLDRTQTDLDGELRSVLAKAVEVEPGAHGSDLGVHEEATPIARVLLPESLGHEKLDPLPDQLLARVA